MSAVRTPGVASDLAYPGFRRYLPRPPARLLSTIVFPPSSAHLARVQRTEHGLCPDHAYLGFQGAHGGICAGRARSSDERSQFFREFKYFAFTVQRSKLGVNTLLVVDSGFALNAEDPNIYGRPNEARSEAFGYAAGATGEPDLDRSKANVFKKVHGHFHLDYAAFSRRATTERAMRDIRSVMGYTLKRGPRTCL